MLSGPNAPRPAASQLPNTQNTVRTACPAYRSVRPCACAPAYGTGLSGVNRIVPFDRSNPSSRSATASTAAGLNGNRLRCFFAARNPSNGLPFHRNAGIYAGLHFDTEGNLLTKEEWTRRRDELLPNAADEAYVQSLMTKPVMDPKQMAHWIAPPPRGIKGRPVDFEYVRRQV